MPSTHAFNKYKHATLTSIKSVSVSDGSNRIQDGSDDDAEYTLNIIGIKRATVTVTFRDINQAYACAALTPLTNFVFQVIKAVSTMTDKTVTVSKVSFGQVELGGQDWDNLQLYTVRGEGGSVTVS